jgi:hypothetical protein
MEVSKGSDVGEAEREFLSSLDRCALIIHGEPS